MIEDFFILNCSSCSFTVRCCSFSKLARGSSNLFEIRRSKIQLSRNKTTIHIFYSVFGRHSSRPIIPVLLHTRKLRYSQQQSGSKIIYSTLEPILFNLYHQASSEPKGIMGGILPRGCPERQLHADSNAAKKKRHY